MKQATSTADDSNASPQFDLRSLLWLMLLVGLSQVTSVYSGWFAFFVAAALAGWEAGFTPRGSFLHILFRNVGALYVCLLAFGAVGCGLMAGESPTGWFGTTGFLFRPLYPRDQNANGLPYWFRYEYALCAAAAIIAALPFAGRVRPAVYVACWGTIALTVYPLFSGWSWPLYRGWLRAPHFDDLYGATRVFALGGWSALAAALVFRRELRDKSDHAPPANFSAPLAAGGLFLLWTLWKNHGAFFSELNIPGQPTSAATWATVLGLAGGLAGSLIGARRFDASLILKGGMAGLVVSAVNADDLGFFWAAVCGFVAGL